MITDAQPMTVECSRCCGTGRRRVSPALRDVLDLLVENHWLSIPEIAARFRGRFGRDIAFSALCNRLRRLADDHLVESERINSRKRGTRPLLYRPAVRA